MYSMPDYLPQKQIIYTLADGSKHRLTVHDFDEALIQIAYHEEWLTASVYCVPWNAPQGKIIKIR